LLAFKILERVANGERGVLSYGVDIEAVFEEVPDSVCIFEMKG
jgi:hypothetical protein